METIIYTIAMIHIVDNPSTCLFFGLTDNPREWAKKMGYEGPLHEHEKIGFHLKTKDALTRDCIISFVDVKQQLNLYHTYPILVNPNSDRLEYMILSENHESKLVEVLTT